LSEAKHLKTSKTKSNNNADMNFEKQPKQHKRIQINQDLLASYFSLIIIEKS